jgi:hypothetical protein
VTRAEKAVTCENSESLGNKGMQLEAICQGEKKKKEEVKGKKGTDNGADFPFSFVPVGFLHMDP